MERRSDTPIPRAEPIQIDVPPIRDLVWPLVWVLAAALPMLARVGWQAALVAGLAALMFREARRRANRSTISFGDGFLAYAGTNGWPHGVQEDDDVHWNWSATRTARPGQGASG